MYLFITILISVLFCVKSHLLVADHHSYSL